jgi:hypothetical protein
MSSVNMAHRAVNVAGGFGGDVLVDQLVHLASRHRPPSVYRPAAAGRYT